jgi:hypothetical protein
MENQEEKLELLYSPGEGGKKTKKESLDFRPGSARPLPSPAEAVPGWLRGWGPMLRPLENW